MPVANGCSCMTVRFPQFPDILQVYAVIAVMLADWPITACLWRLSAWLLLLNLGEIATIFAYGMAANFLESMFVLLLFLGASVLFPAKFLRSDFVVRGTILAIGLISAMIAFVGFQMRVGIERGLLLWVPPVVVLSLMVFLLRRASKSSSLRSAALWLSDRLVIFLLVLIPLFALSAVYVIFRNVV